MLRAAGTNCDRELDFALKRCGSTVVAQHILQVRDSPEQLLEYDLLAIPGGFTYGDDVSGGKILALELQHYLGDAVRSHLDRGGSILGICNGFQVLVKSGLWPGVSDLAISLTWNDSHRFECRWTRLQVGAGAAHLLPEGSFLAAPAAHAEGKFVVDSPSVLDTLDREGLVAFRYASSTGTPTGDYPDNPNGSDGQIAGLASAEGRVLGLMPHPERNLSSEHLPDRGTGSWGAGGEGLDLIRAMLSRYRS